MATTDINGLYKGFINVRAKLLIAAARGGDAVKFGRVLARCRKEYEEIGGFDLGEVMDGDNDTGLLHAALEGGRAEIVRLCVEWGCAPDGVLWKGPFAGSTPMHFAACVRTPELAALLAGLGGDPNAVDRRGRTPLMWAVAAVRGGEIGNVQALLACGADVASADADGRTAWDFAVTRGTKDIADCLRAAGGGPRAAG